MSDVRDKPTRTTRPSEAAATLAIAVPIALASIAQMAMAVTDTIMLGGVGPEALAAGGLGGSIFFSTVFALQGTLSAAGVLIARARGAGDAATIPRAYWSGMAVAAALTAIVFLVASFPEPLLARAGIPAGVTADVAVYLDVLRWGAPGALVGLGLMRAVLPALGQERLLIMVVPLMALLNAALNVWFIHGGLGLPAYGLRGSAAATAVTLWISAAALLAVLHGCGDPALWPPRVSRRTLRELLDVGLPVSGAILLEVTLFLATGLAAGSFGADALAAHTIALSFATVTFMVPLALGQAANVRVGMAAAAGRVADARHAGLVAIGLAMGFMVASALAMVIVPRWIVGLYLNPGSGPTTAAVAVGLLRVSAMFQVVDGTQAIAAGALRGLKDTRVPMLIALAGYWGIGFWSGRWFAFDQGFDARGLWLGLFAGLSVSAVCLTWRFLLLTRGGGRP